MNVLNLEHISKVYGDKVIFDDISCGIHQGDKIGIIGINGTGKTTFLRILAGLEEADEGQVITQNGLRITYLPQHPQFPEGATILSYVTQGQKEQSWNPETEAHMVLNKLGIEDHEEEIEHLSGGQKKRVALAAVLVNPTDVLILDEPTNHMDLAGKEALEKMLTSYEGTVLFVSHDRYFINQVATGILEFGESDVQFYGMNYAQYLEEIKRQTPGRETGNAGGVVRKPADVPTLDDVFDKKKYYNPGKILSRLKRQLEKYEEQLAESESRMSELQLEMMDPELSANYEQLMELQTKIDEENQVQESLLERMMETELELEEMETQDE